MHVKARINRSKYIDQLLRHSFFGTLLCVSSLGITGMGHAHGDLLSDTDTDNVRNLLLLSAAGVAAYHRDAAGLRQFGSSVLLTSGITLVAKSLIDANRPNGEDNDSFPSGHAATAFAGAGFMHRRYGLKYGIPAYLAATSVALSRVENEHHRLVDVAAGGLIALIVNQYLVSARPTLQAQVSPTSLWVGVHYTF